ncbi:enoyl-CoA hydratase/isomerase family protein [Croceicoccus mobilis]|uniref:Enoyl-CoA hydratase n=1 Tax=Croceicoccus mobilis TaxID=1703339 RepID=A0A916Z7Y8_9SPHN|nr:enoyl-CoA hydratase/isomerase family protein [Croceicoccus mobilis]GGD79517.1 enoyl-CoA hydratase [Croceicoccus mobilis]
MTELPYDIDGAKLLISGAVATILLDRPQARNAMQYRVWSALPDMMAKACANPEVGVIVIRGAGGTFGAGNDISELGQICGDADACRSYGLAMAGSMRAIEMAAKPVIAAIEGNCYGASVALAIAADLRIASDTARFAITPAKLGAVYLQSDHHRLVSLIGPARARQMIFTARSIDAAQAEAWGLISQVAAPDRFEEDLAALVDGLLSGSAYTLMQSKRMIRSCADCEAPEETEETVGWFVDAMLGQDFAEGLDAFLSKRKPRFASGYGGA